MPTYIAPGVHIEKISKTRPSIEGVETAIPVFIGFTEKTKDENDHSLVNVPIRLKSLHEFEEIFGKADAPEIEVSIKQVQKKESGQITVTNFIFSVESGNDRSYFPNKLLHYAMQMFYSNGGGTCYVVSIGDYQENIYPEPFINAFSILESFDEPTLLVFPDACLCGCNGYGNVTNAGLAHCKKMRDRFAIIDVPNAVPGGTFSNIDVTNDFRDKITSDFTHLKYGAAYFPYLRTGIQVNFNDKSVSIKEHKVFPMMADGTLGPDEKGIFEDRKLNGKDTDGKYFKEKDPFTYNEVKKFLNCLKVTLPPSAAVAGAYVRVDLSRGVWKAPANVSLNNVIEPAIKINNDLGEEPNIDHSSGKSVNAIRAFSGRGNRIWGARTLAGNDNENRYVPVRRFLNFVEESIKKAIARFVFETNDVTTWKKVQSMIENFLIVQWRNGALQGAKTEDAFFVKVGLNKTMTAQDILDGRMIVEIGIAMVRPAEFILLRIIQMITK